MPTIDFLPFAVGGGANVEPQSSYAAETTLLANGFQSGVAPSAKFNKALRQSSLISASVAQFIAAQSGANVIDDGTTSTIVANLTAAINSLASANASSVQGVAKNLNLSASGMSAAVLVTADEISVESASNTYKTLRAVSLSISGTSVGANALDAGTIASSTWYSVWVIHNGTTTAGLLSLSETAPTLPSGYTHKARVGWIRTDGTGNKYPLAFKQYGRKVQWATASGANLTVLPTLASGVGGTYSTTTPTWASVSTSSAIPPTASEIAIVISNGGGSAAIAAPNNTYGGAISATSPAPIEAATGTSLVNNGRMLIEVANTIYWTSSGAACFMQCLGWEDNL